MAARPRVVVAGGGLLGCALADELTERGWTDVTVLGGGEAAGHPGLVFRTDADRTLTEFAKYTAAKYGGLDGPWCFNPVGSLDLATTPERLADLERRHGWATSWGVRGFLRTPRECADLHPLLDETRLLGGFHVPGDGLLHARRAAEAQARRAKARGARFSAEEVVAVERAGGRVTGVVTASGRLRADVVVSCDGFGEPEPPRLPHRYARTSPLPELAGRNDEHVQAGLPVLRDLGTGLYAREHVDRLGIGAADRDAAAELLPALRAAALESTTTILLPGTPDGMPVLGEQPDLDGFWVAKAVRAEHSAGVARELARWLVDGQPSLALHGCDLARFALPARFTAEPVRTSPFHERQIALGAHFGPAEGWARPERYADAEAEALATRERVAMFDLTPVPRLAVTGPGRAAVPAGHDHRRPREGTGHGDGHAAARRRRRGARGPDRGPAGRRAVPRRRRRAPGLRLAAAAPARRRHRAAPRDHARDVLRRRVGTVGRRRAAGTVHNGLLGRGDIPWRGPGRRVATVHCG